MKYFPFTTLALRPERLMSPSDAGAGAGAGGAEGSVADTEPGDGGAEGSRDAGAGGAPGAGGADSGSDDTPWYDKRDWSDPSLKEHVVKSGYHSGTAEEALEKALKGEMTATAKLGKDPKSLVELPGEGKTALDFLKANGAQLGVPETIEKYELALPADLPEGLPVNENMMADFTKAAFEAGIPPAVAQFSVDAYAQHVTGWFSEMQGTMAANEQKLETAMKEKWGGNWEETRDRGVRAFQTIAAQKGWDADATKNIASKLNEGMGDVHLMMMMDAMAELMSEDTLTPPPGGGAPASDLAAAQQRKTKIMAKGDGDMAKAKGNPARISQLQNELKGLNRIIEQHTKT